MVTMMHVKRSENYRLEGNPVEAQISIKMNQKLCFNLDLSFRDQEKVTSKQELDQSHALCFHFFINFLEVNHFSNS